MARARPTAPPAASASEGGRYALAARAERWPQAPPAAGSSYSRPPRPAPLSRRRLPSGRRPGVGPTAARLPPRTPRGADFQGRRPVPTVLVEVEQLFGRPPAHGAKPTASEPAPDLPHPVRGSDRDGGLHPR